MAEMAAVTSVRCTFSAALEPRARYKARRGKNNAWPEVGLRHSGGLGPSGH